MIIKVALAGGSLEGDSVVARRMMEWLRDFGVYVARGVTIADTALPEMIYGLTNQNVKKRWEVFLKANLLRHNQPCEPDAWPRGVLVVPPVPAYLEECDVVLVGSESAGAFEGSLDDGWTRLDDPEVEVVISPAIDGSPSFTSARDSARTTIKMGAVVDDVWSVRFEPFLRHGRQISIVDRYCGRAVCEVGSGLARALAGIEAVCDGAKVQVFTGFKEGDRTHAETIRREIETLTDDCWSGIRELELFLAPIDQFTHDRYIRVDQHWIKLGKGVDVLRGARVADDCTYNYELLDGDNHATYGAQIARLKQISNPANSAGAIIWSR